jgi:uncharacterized protein
VNLARKVFAGLSAALLAVMLLTAPASAALKFPALTGRVVDDAHILSPQIQAELTQELGALEAKTSRQLIVVTIPSLEGYDIADYGYQLGRAWGVGQKTLNNGAIFIIAPTEHKVRIEVGYGLEGVMTDAMSNVILQRSVLPRFRAGDIPGGVVDGTQAIVEQLSLDTSVAEQKAAQAAAPVHRTRSGGGPLGLIVILVVIAFVLRSVLSGGGGGGLAWFLPGLLMGGLGRGGFGGGRDDDDGGGGFGGGGGGSFGGGGSSGSW